MSVSVRMGMRMRSGVEEAVTGVAGLEALRWTHEAGDAVDRCRAGERRGQPRVQGEGVAHGSHAGVNWRRTVKSQHGGVVELHGAGVHLFLTTPLSPAVLEPDLGANMTCDYRHIYQIFAICKVGALQSFAVNVSVLKLLDQIRATCNQDVLFPPKYSEKYSVSQQP